MKRKGVGKNLVIVIVAVVAIAGIAGVYLLTGSQANLKVKDMNLSQKKIVQGESVSAKVEVTNDDGAKGSKTISLKVDGEVVNEKEVTLSAGETDTFDLEWSSKETGNYKISVLDFSETLDVVKPANFEITNLNTAPKNPKMGETVNVSVEVKNSGGIGGTKQIEFNIAGEIKTEEVTLDSGASKELSVHFTLDESGNYDVTVENMTKTFEVSFGWSNVSSLKLKFERKNGSVRTGKMWMKNVGTQNLKFRHEYTQNGSEIKMVLNGETKEVWIYNQGQWYGTDNPNVNFENLRDLVNEVISQVENNFSGWSKDEEISFKTEEGNDVRLYDIQVNPELKNELFKVEMPAQIHDVALSKDVKDYQPVNETKVFNTTDNVIYLTFEVSNIQAGTEINAKWYDNQGNLIFSNDPFRWDQAKDGRIPTYFGIYPTGNAWSSGNYSVALIKNGEEIELIEFKIK